MKQKENLLWYNTKIILMLLFLYFTTPCLSADHDNSLRTDLNVYYTINEQFRSVSFVFLQADKDMSYQSTYKWRNVMEWQIYAR